METLDLAGNGGGGLCGLSEADWEKLFCLSDRTQLTLSLGQKAGENLPSWVRRRFERSRAQNALRWDRVKATFKECSWAFSSANIPFIVLKGFSHCPDLIADPRLRVQYDLDLLFLPHDIRRAYGLALQLGFEPQVQCDRFPTDHFPTLVRKTGWEWRGDFFDPDIPISLELHFQLWDERTEMFAPTGLERFWERRQIRSLEELKFTSFSSVDLIGYSCAHILRHLLRGSLRPSHVYELALFLNRKCDDSLFWTLWEKMHEPSLRRIETIVFGLASQWFGCRLSLCIQESLQRLPAEIVRWLAMHGESPITDLFYPNKDEILLHWCLLDSSRSRLIAAGRRLLPHRFPGAVRGLHAASGTTVTWKVKLSQIWAYVRFVLCRVKYHVSTIAPVALSVFRWWCIASFRREIGSQFRER